MLKTWFLVALLVITDTQAFAAGNGDWVKPATGLIDDLQSGMIQIGIPIVGVGVLAFGIWGIMSGRIEWGRLFGIIFCGLLLTVGPSVVTGLLGS